MIRLIRQYLARRRLAQSLRPDPQAYAKNRAGKQGWETRKRNMAHG